MSNPELFHPQHDESRAILADLKEQLVERLEADVQRQAGIIKALHEKLAEEKKKTERYLTLIDSDVLEVQARIEHKDAHIRAQGLIIVSLRNQNNALKAGRNVAQEWHDESNYRLVGTEREDLP